ncbi:MAG: hypothetical protein K2X49_12780 [Acetobacteraceae bacterium]|nr:hypothetical protein [Acetobacteraceae bacterium]
MPRHREPEAQPGATRALAIALAWMFAVQLLCLVLWNAVWLTRAEALVHWLALGVLPPALALWTSGRAPRPDRAGG